MFITNSFLENVIQCEVLYSKQILKADHFPVVTVCEMAVTRNEEVKGNFQEVDWERFEEELGRRLERVGKGKIRMREEVEEQLDAVMEVLERMVEVEVPERWVVTGMKRWWSKELTEMKMRARVLGRELFRLADVEGHQVHEAFRLARNAYSQAIKDTKQKHWEGWLEGVDARTV